MSNNNRSLTELARQIQSSEGLKYTEALRKAEWSTLVQPHRKYTSPEGNLHGLANDYLPFIASLNPFKRKSAEDFNSERLYSWVLSGGIGSEPIDLVLQNPEGDIDYIGACGFYPVDHESVEACGIVPADYTTGNEEHSDFITQGYFGHVSETLSGNKYRLETVDPLFLDSDNRIIEADAFIFSIDGDYVEQASYLLDLSGVATREEKIKLASEFVNEIVKTVV